MSSQAATPLSVMIVDDAATVRSYISRIVEEQAGMQVHASLANGALAVRRLQGASKQSLPDIILLDIAMPVMDGMTALPLLRENAPTTPILIVTGLARENATLGVDALQKGADDCLAKPVADEALTDNAQFKSELLKKIVSLCASHRKKHNIPLPRELSTIAQQVLPARSTTNIVSPAGKYRHKPRALAIGSSTGGPQAVIKMLKAVPCHHDLPIFITQHMPAHFTKIFAEQINRETAWSCEEGRTGMPVKGGQVYLAPGNTHMLVKSTASTTEIVLSSDPPENFCRPAVDPMLRSLVDTYKDKLAVVILTGMGHDGLKGCQGVVKAGGVVLAQDEKTSVVWGMPGAVAGEGLCQAVLPLEEIAPYLGKEILKREVAA